MVKKKKNINRIILPGEIVYFLSKILLSLCKHNEISASSSRHIIKRHIIDKYTLKYQTKIIHSCYYILCNAINMLLILCYRRAARLDTLYL